MQCPSCETSLRITVERDVEIDVCDQCHGVWLDAGELDALAENKQLTPGDAVVNEVRDLTCPRCDRADFCSVETTVGSFARCTNCGGVFVDGQTLDRLSKCERSALPSMGSAATTADLLTSLVEFLWLFTHH